jgi:hypothetical protein
MDTQDAGGGVAGATPPAAEGKGLPGGRSADVMAIAARAPTQAAYRISAAANRRRAEFSSIWVHLSTNRGAVVGSRPGGPFRPHASSSWASASFGRRAVSKSKTLSKSERESLGVFSRSPDAIIL